VSSNVTVHKGAVVRHAYSSFSCDCCTPVWLRLDETVRPIQALCSEPYIRLHTQTPSKCDTGRLWNCVPLDFVWKLSCLFCENAQRC